MLLDNNNVTNKQTNNQYYENLSKKYQMYLENTQTK